MKRHIRPVANANGIHKNIGWHTFRHSFGTLLKANGEDVKTGQELLRHANSRITLDVYTQAVNSNKREAQSKVVKMMVSNVGTKLTNAGTTESVNVVGSLSRCGSWFILGYRSDPFKQVRRVDGFREQFKTRVQSGRIREEEVIMTRGRSYVPLLS